MIWAVGCCVMLMLKVAISWPIAAYADSALAYDLTGDYMDSYYGPWSLDYLRGGRLPGLRSVWPFDRYGLSGDFLDPYNPDFLPRSVDYGYFNGYPKTTEFAKENYVRDNPYGGTEVGIRDSVSTRNAPWRSGMSRMLPYALPRSGWRGMDRMYNPFFDYDLPYSSFRRPFLPPLSGAARPSSLRWGGDLTYLRR